MFSTMLLVEKPCKVMLGTDMIFIIKPAVAGTSILMASPMTITLPFNVTPIRENTKPNSRQAANADR